MITTDKAAKILGISPRRIRALIASGRLPAIKLARDWIIDEKDLEKVVDRKPGRPRLTH
jgi:excisionase family DNA binding protein